MMRTALLLLLGVTLTGCVTAEERMRAQIARQDAECKSWGAEPGSQKYMPCRAIISQREAAQEELQRERSMALVGMGAAMMANGR
jgi:hypothetical protein